jgi:hypothetical protein
MPESIDPDSDLDGVFPYVYQQLESPQHIWLMHLGPSLDQAAPLRFTFSQGHHNDLQGQYEALSYTWGVSDLVNPLLHVRKETTYLCIIKNLDGALRRLRYKHEDRSLWADAVCIQQDDDEEKSSQIPLMAEIYRGAERVVAWLGFVGPDSDEEKGLHFLARMARQWRHLEGPKRHARGRIPDRFDKLGPEINANAEHVIALCNLQWFRRLWIIQEAVANHELVLLTTESQLPWTRFVSALRFLQMTQAWRSKAAGQRYIDAIGGIVHLWSYHSGLGGDH